MAKAKSTTREASRPRTDWRSLSDEQEKYQAYLCSREWAEKKEAIHKRAGGKCERCRVFPINAVHHLNYARKYKEELTDLMGTCKHCHAFTHAKADFDPSANDEMTRYLKACVFRSWGGFPIPSGVIDAGASGKMVFFGMVLETLFSLLEMWQLLDEQLCDSDCTGLIENLAYTIDREAGFNLSDLPNGWTTWDGCKYAKLRTLFGFADQNDRGFAVVMDNQE